VTRNRVDAPAGKRFPSWPVLRLTPAPSRAFEVALADLLAHFGDREAPVCGAALAVTAIAGTSKPAATAAPPIR
jgi:hypothetical protein